MSKVTESFLKKGITKDSSVYDVIASMMSLRLFIQMLFATSFIFSAYISFKYLSQPILESYGFRQAQTALTSYYLIQNGFSFSYWTPVLGQGWSIPFEFPIYQQVVATVAQWLGAPLTNTGRAVSWMSTALCCIPIYFALRELGFDKNTRFYSLALFMSSPLYLFWAGTFMMESAALFFVLCFIFYATKIINRTTSTGDYILASLFLTLGLLQKVTTGLPIVFIFLCFFSLWTLRPSDFRNNKRYLLKTYAAVFISVFLAYGWVKFSDQIKMENPLGSKLSSAALAEWNFGSLGQRLSPQLWHDVIWDRISKQNLSGIAGIITLSGSLFLARENKTKILILALLLAGLLPLFLFTNLHIVHTYYQTANCVFLLIALGVAVTTIGDCFLIERPIIHGAFLAFFVAANFYFFVSDPLRLKASVINSENNHILKVADFVKTHTNKDDTVIWYGFDWSSEAAFYSERKSLAIADWMNASTDAIDHTEKYLRTPPGAIVLCLNAADTDKIRMAIMNKYKSLKPQTVDSCEVYRLTTAAP